ncbi:23S rRNA (uracil(1939)-C(5))-methyltransferase RlmD [Clostridium sp. D2Q-11]|uniref:23S rRNA (Uracil(1939)-C(5))-methyltransferase RlmD n=1 Tax=Anaeromonas frigoriresistens TaxID=2683708 RepID=A0A942UUI2_9FIRM|nr:23S rRNA (uracil(1939)-C(5))-methyltransferase RlmD [Anaeromonas frigoriresistens]MBS4539489.1 23S rRNA (uracil(1939)-C(5))-methyltransferase RlmD [Anaeromonas frigoriresistens]
MGKKKKEFEVKIENVEFPNKGIGEYNGKKVIIKDTIAGQKVMARVKKDRKNKIEARLLEVLERDEKEIEPRCVHFWDCGGCSYQNLTYEDQLDMKKNQVLEILQKADIDNFEFEGIERSPKSWEYRNKMEFTFGDEYKDGPLSLGMHQKGKFYEILSVPHCQIVDEDFTDILTTVLEYFKEKEVPFYHKMRHEGVLRHLVIRKAANTGEILVNLVTSSQKELDLAELIDELKEIQYIGKLKGFLHTINDGLADTVQSDETRVLYGDDYITEELLGLSFNISAFSFFQTNSLGAERLYEIVREYAGETDNKTVFDLYCGTGTIAQIMAPVAKKVVGIEIVEEAVEKAKDNAVLNDLNNCEFIAGDVLVEIDNLKEAPDLIILDPPRSGVHTKAIKKIADFNSPRIVYVSCKPTSLAEDLQEFKELGYEVKKVKCMDMFPHTPHVETVCLIEKNRLI